MSDNIKSLKNHGFTLVELTISITLMGILSVSLLAIIMTYTVIMTRNNHIADMTFDSQNLLRSTVEELRYGAGVREVNTIPDANAPGSGWNTSNDNFVIIIASPATDENNDYIINPATALPYNNELVFYKNGTNLYRRTLAHPDAIGNTRTTSCPLAVATSSCPADTLLLPNTKDMVFTLYDSDDASTTNPLLAHSININLIMERETFGKPLTLQNSIRTTLRNRFQ